MQRKTPIIMAALMLVTGPAMATDIKPSVICSPNDLECVDGQRPESDKTPPAKDAAQDAKTGNLPHGHGHHQHDDDSDLVHDADWQERRRRQLEIIRLQQAQQIQQLQIQNELLRQQQQRQIDDEKARAEAVAAEQKAKSAQAAHFRFRDYDRVVARNYLSTHPQNLHETLGEKPPVVRAGEALPDKLGTLPVPPDLAKLLPEMPDGYRYLMTRALILLVSPDNLVVDYIEL